jgi:hypothetical protein
LYLRTKDRKPNLPTYKYNSIKNTAFQLKIMINVTLSTKHIFVSSFEEQVCRCYNYSNMHNTLNRLQIIPRNDTSTAPRIVNVKQLAIIKLAKTSNEIQVRSEMNHFPGPKSPILLLVCSHCPMTLLQ